MDQNLEQELRKRIAELEKENAYKDTMLKALKRAFEDYYYDLSHSIDSKYELYPVTSLEDYVALGYDASSYVAEHYEGMEEYGYPHMMSKSDSEKAFKELYEAMGVLQMFFEIGLVEKFLLNEWEKFKKNNRTHRDKFITIKKDGHTETWNKDFYLDRLAQGKDPLEFEGEDDDDEQ